MTIENFSKLEKHLTVILAEPEREGSQVEQAMHFAEQEIDHLVELRNGEETRSLFTDAEEEALWRIKSKIELVLSSIRVEQAMIAQKRLRLIAAE